MKGGHRSRPAADTQVPEDHRSVTAWEQRFHKGEQLSTASILVSGIIDHSEMSMRQHCCSYQKYKTSTWN